MHKLNRKNLYNTATSRSINVSPIHQLRAQWVLLFLITGFVLTTGYTFLSAVWERTYSFRWLILTALGSGYILWSVWDSLKENHHPAERRLRPNLGPANYVTISRGLMLAAAFGFISSPTPPGRMVWAPALLYTLAAFSDLLDGYLARATGNPTRLGETLDMRFDGLGVLIACLLAFQYGKVPAVYLLVGLARYIFLGGIWLRRQIGYKVYNLPTSPIRRILAGVQMVYLFAVLWPVTSPEVTSVLAYFTAIPFLVGFLRDWCFVSGILRETRGNSS